MMSDLQREIPRCTYSIYKTLTAMIEAGQAG